jgi:hypothetical protein
MVSLSMIRTTFFSLMVMAVSLMSSPASAQSRGIVFVEPGAPLVWKHLDVPSGEARVLGEFGVMGDQIAMGRWLGTGDAQLGVVSIDSTTKEIVWSVSAAGRTVEKRLGMAGDTVVAAADFDASGIDDPMIVSKVGRRLSWTVAFDLFRGGRRKMSFQMGYRDEVPFFLNLDESGPWLGSVAVDKNGTIVRLLNPRTGERRQVRRLPVIVGTSSPKPVALRAPKGSQLLAISRQQGSVTLLSLIDLEARKVVTQRVTGLGDLVVGDFLEDEGDEFALVSSDTVVVGNPFSGSKVTVARPQGNLILIDSFNINTISGGADSHPSPHPTASPRPAPQATRTPGGSGGTGSTPTSLNAVCASRSSIASGEMLIKSEASDHIHNGDPRTTGYTLVCARLCPSNQSYAQFFYSDGSFAGAVARYGTFRGNGRPRLYGAVGRAPQHFASEIADKAASIGNGKLYLQISAATEGRGTVCKEFNPTGRNGSLY